MLLGGLQLLPADAGAQTSGASGAALEALTAQLADPKGEVRKAALQSLSGLEAERVHEIGARLDMLKRQRPPVERVRRALADIRHVVGSQRADDEVDILPGVLPVLMKRRDGDFLAVIEPLLLMRSLEGIGNRDAGLLIARYLHLDGGLWRNELRMTRQRMGDALLPALIELRASKDGKLREWARFSMRSLDRQSPQDATNLEDPHLLSQVIRAYTTPPDFKAMPTLVKLVRHDKLQVREAARAAVTAFGQNAVWKLREAYEDATGQRANPGWGWEQTARELYTVLDRPAMEEAQTAMAKGMQRFVQGDVEAMQNHYDRVLARVPRFTDRHKMAPGYAALGEHRFEADDLDAAHDAYALAIRLAPEAPDAQRWRAMLSFVQAERALSHGLVDEARYEAALEADPELEAAEAAHEGLASIGAARIKSSQRWAAMGAVGILLAMAMLLLRGERRETPRAAAVPGSAMAEKLGDVSHLDAHFDDLLGEDPDLDDAFDDLFGEDEDEQAGDEERAA
jgi:tetratricopeptide (TPR) repeat protein